ncbi:gas vesicle protein, partial [Streptomyces sp. SID9913]
AAERVDAELRGHAVAAVRHRPQDERLTGRSAPQVLNAAYLVDDADRDRFTAALARLTGDGRCPGVEVAASGPWIPYSFARWEEGPD